MTYTVKQLAQLASVSIRTLHYYDEIGLLPPPLIGATGYRLYNQDSVLRLQSILFYRELDFPLEAIKAMLDRPDFNPLQVLQEQRTALEARLGRLHRVIATIDLTIRHIKEKTPMNAKEMFVRQTAEKEQAYAEEAGRRWDPATVKASQQRWKRYSRDRQREILEEGNQVYRDLAAVMSLGPEAQAVQSCIERWRAHVNHFWSPNGQQCLGLAQLYVDDPGFRANFDSFDPDLATFMVEAVKVHVARRQRTAARRK